MIAVQSPTDKIAMAANRITPPVTGPLTVPSGTDTAAASADTPTSRPGANRIALAVASLALLIGVLCCALAVPASAATVDGSSGTVGSGTGTPRTNPIAGRPIASSDGLVVGALCVVGIVGVAGGVLWYTVRTRRTLD